MNQWLNDNPVGAILRLFSFMAASLLVFVMTACRDMPDIGNGKETGITGRDTILKPALKKVKILPYWYPTAQFAGYIVGIEKGIFRKYGIDLEIVPYDQSADMEKLIKDKKVDFAVLWLVNALKMKDNGVDILNIAQFSTRSSLMLITKKSSGINTIEKMNGKRAGIWQGYELQPGALFKKYGLQVTTVPIGSTNSLFLLDGVDIINANWFDEYHSILNSGFEEDELNKFFFSDYGLNFLEDGIYCLEDLVTKDPGLCISFAKASVESWEYAFTHQEESVRLVVGNARLLNFPVNASHQRWMLHHYHKLYTSGKDSVINTDLPEKEYNLVGRIMVSSGQISSLQPFTEFYHPVVQ